MRIKVKTLLLCVALGTTPFINNHTKASAITIQNDTMTVFDKFPYENLWKEVDSLRAINLPKSALEIVEKIYSRAKQEKKNDQLVKAIIYRLGLKATFEENFSVTIIQSTKAEIKENDDKAVKALLHSMLAEIYWQYYQQNRWKFYNRSQTVDFDNDDIETWDLTRLVKEVFGHYKLSLENKAILQKISLEEYSAILLEKPGSKKYRPTLFDLIAHRALDFFKSSEPDIIRPANYFTINDSLYFSNVNTFSTLPLSTSDDISTQFEALKLYQELTVFHLNDDDPLALLEVTTDRLQFVRENAVSFNVDKHYLQAMNTLYESYSNHNYAAGIKYLIAKYYAEKADKTNINTGNSEERWYYKKAIRLCLEVLEEWQTTADKSSLEACKELISRIEKVSLEMKVEEIAVPGQHLLLFTEYKNCEEVFYHLVRTDRKSYYQKRKDLSREELIRWYATKSYTRMFAAKTGDPGDYRKHTFELETDPLEPGFYVLIASNNKDFNPNNGYLAAVTFQVSSIAYVKRENADESIDIYVVNRDNGQPLNSVILKTYNSFYDYNKRTYVEKFYKSFKTDQEGYIRIPAGTNKSVNLSMQYFYGNDTLYGPGSIYLSKPYRYKKEITYKTHFFTDRSIYRPGQTVYFKGIVLRDVPEEPIALSQEYKTNVTLFDVNGQKVESLKLTTNEYGSFHGSFTLPSTGLTGNMRIASDNGSVYVSVEEYKRPKFKVHFNPVEGSYKLNEKVEITGYGEAFAGYNLTGATVAYRVTRHTQHPYWKLWWGYRSVSEPVEIDNGETIIGDDGKFIITFNTLPDLSQDPVRKPVFIYEVSADVTDINGETHSASANVSVGYTALLLNANVPSTIIKEDIPELSLNTTNLNNSFIPVKGIVKVYKISQEETPYIKRYWPEPDESKVPERDFKKHFPWISFPAKGDVEQKKLIHTMSFNTADNKKLNIEGLTSWQSGRYLLVVEAADPYGDSVSIENPFLLFSTKEKQLPVPAVDWHEVLKSTAEPGELVSFMIGSSVETRYLFEIEKNGEVIEKRFITLKNQQKHIVIPITEEHRGGISYHLVAVNKNRYFYHKEYVNVPYSNKKLSIEFETFRDKLQPGQKEEYRVIIKGPNDLGVAAELLAGMYDASLDEIKQHGWHFFPYPMNYSYMRWNSDNFSYNQSLLLTLKKWPEFNIRKQQYDRLNWFDLVYSYGYYHGGRYLMKNAALNASKVLDSDDKILIDNDQDIEMEAVSEEIEIQDSIGVNEKEAGQLSTGNGTEAAADGLAQIKARTNFNETAFFFPQLKTDEAGNVVLSFTIPESLTKWKLMCLAHTSDVKVGNIVKTLVTQKELMVIPNAPRFFRENDKMVFTTKVTNLSDDTLRGNISLTLTDAITGSMINDITGIGIPEQPFEVNAGQSVAVAWNIMIPESVQAITYRVAAKGGAHTDAEEMTIPVLTNRMLVTESLPLPVRGITTKSFTFQKLKESEESTTLHHRKLTLEFTANPVWYAIQALPYLMEYPYECNEQIFSRFYANTLASHIVNTSPRIKQVFDSWKQLTPDALVSNLEKNQELKALLLEETPWVMEAKDETARKNRVAMLFDLNKMSNELENALYRLRQNQLSNGGWAWFTGGPDSWYITQHIATGFGRLHAMKIISVDDKSYKTMMKNAVTYLDDRIYESYNKLLLHYKNDPEGLKKEHISYLHIQYLYCRTFFLDLFPLNSRSKKAYDYYFNQAKRYWMNKNLYMQGFSALALHRGGERATAELIIQSLKERSIHSEEMGMYWRSERSWYWYQAPIETQALMIEAFDEVAKDLVSVEAMKIWLLKQKQTQDWKTTKATVEACYALIMRGADLLQSTKPVEITIGGEKIDIDALEDTRAEAGTGYFKTSWDGKQITPEMAEITIKKKDEGVAWGAVYWQYFEQLDKITTAETPLQLKKQLFKTCNTPEGPVIKPLTEGAKLQVGDKIKVRIELRVDRDMEYVHMKDMRAATFEPLATLSGYKWQDGLGYYESPRDAAMNFFFDYLRKGTYVFEYELYTTHAGDYSNGITTIQCMYAPEFSSHSEGIRVIVE